MRHFISIYFLIYFKAALLLLVVGLCSSCSPKNRLVIYRFEPKPRDPAALIYEKPTEKRVEEAKKAGIQPGTYRYEREIGIPAE